MEFPVRLFSHTATKGALAGRTSDTGVAEAAEVVPGHRVGLRLTGSVSDAAAAQLYGLGFRRYAVDARETRTFLLALGKAALSD